MFLVFLSRPPWHPLDHSLAQEFDSDTDESGIEDMFRYLCTTVGITVIMGETVVEEVTDLPEDTWWDIKEICVMKTLGPC